MGELSLRTPSGIATRSPEKMDPATHSKALIEKNAKEYTSYLMSTFAKAMLETCKKEDESTEKEIMGTSFLGDALGEAMLDSGAGEFIQDDLLTSMLEMQGSSPQGSHTQGSSPQEKTSTTNASPTTGGDHAPS